MISVIWPNNPTSKWMLLSMVGNSVWKFLPDLTKFLSLELFAHQIRKIWSECSQNQKETSSSQELIMELAKLGTKGFMCLEAEEQLENEPNTSTTSWCSTKRRKSGKTFLLEKEMPQPPDLDLFRFAFTTTSSSLEVKVREERFLETCGFTTLSRKIGMKSQIQRKLTNLLMKMSKESSLKLESRQLESSLTISEQQSFLEGWVTLTSLPAMFGPLISTW